jgi:hypothetical protein
VRQVSGRLQEQELLTAYVTCLGPIPNAATELRMRMVASPTVNPADRHILVPFSEQRTV